MPPTPRSSLHASTDSQHDPQATAQLQMLEAERLRQAGDFNRAEALCEKLLRQHPDYVAALHTLGLIYADRGKYSAALPYAVKAVMLNPEDWRGLTALSGVYLRLDAREMAARTLETALKIKPDEPSIHATLGEIFREEREYELAADAYQSALGYDPSLHVTKYGLALVYANMGRLTEASRALLEILKFNRRSLPVVSLLATLPGLPGSADLQSLLAEVKREGTEDKTAFDCHYTFAEGWILHKNGRFDLAWQKFLLANRLGRELGRKSAAADDAARQAVLARTRTGRSQPFSGRGSGTKSLFLLGPTRSGKTTLEALLGGLKGVKRGYENPIVERAIRRTSQEAGLLTHSRASRLPPGLDPQFRKHYTIELEQRARGAAAFTNTHPGWISDAARLAEALPEVRFVLVKRDPDDLLLRIFMQHYKRGNEFAYDIASIREYVRWYHDMIDALAARFPSIAMIVRYEDMVENPGAVLKTVAEFCGLELTGHRVPPTGDDRGCAKPYRDFWSAPAEESSPMRKEITAPG